MARLCLAALACAAVAAVAAASALADDAPPPDGKQRALAAELAVAQGRDLQALDDSSAALLAGYETPALRLVRAQALYSERRFGEALREADRALALNADSAQGRLWRAKALLSLGREAEGLDDLRRAAAMDAALAPEYEREASRRSPSPLRRALPWAAGALLAAGAAAAAVLRRKDGARLVRFGTLIRMPAAADELREGSVLGGRYVVGRRAEKDVWGQAYEGRDLDDRAVVILRFAPAAGGPRAFRPEAARSAAALRHPGLAPLEAVFEQGAWGLAVEPADQTPTLAEALRRRGAPLPADRLASVAPVCEALDAAHAVGLVHGAITARALRAADGGWRLSGLGLPPVGAPPPEAPEGGGPTPAADLYALACALREAAPRSREAGAPPGLEAFFSRALQKDPARRFKTAAELRLALLSVVSPAVH